MPIGKYKDYNKWKQEKLSLITFKKVFNELMR